MSDVSDPWDMLNNFCFFMCKLKSDCFHADTCDSRKGSLGHAEQMKSYYLNLATSDFNPKLFN